MLTTQIELTAPQVKTSWQDPVLKELHATREKLASEYGNDIREICEAARRGNFYALRKGQRSLDATQWNQGLVG